MAKCKEFDWMIGLHFGSKDKELYDCLRNEADTIKIPVSAYIKLILRGSIKRDV